MRDIADHLLDLCQNSITAGASLITITLITAADGQLQLGITDDGCGMDQETVQKALSPFGTSRSTRKVGLGIPLAAEHARQSGGSFSLTSQPGEGTSLQANFQTQHLDCPPLGDLAASLLALILSNPQQPDFLIQLGSLGAEDQLDTRQVKAALQGVPLTSPLVHDWLQANLQEMICKHIGGTP